MAALFRTGGQIQQGLGQGRDVILRYDDTVAAILDNLQLAGKIAHHHGHTKGHGFGQGRRQPVHIAAPGHMTGSDEDVRTAVQIGHGLVRQLTGEGDELAQAKAPGKQPQTQTPGARAHQSQPEVDSGLLQGQAGLQQGIVALAASHGPHGQQLQRLRHIGRRHGDVFVRRGQGQGITQEHDAPWIHGGQQLADSLARCLRIAAHEGSLFGLHQPVLGR